MADELLQEVETNDLVKYYSQLCNQQVALECEQLLWQALLIFQIESVIPSLSDGERDRSQIYLDALRKI